MFLKLYFIKKQTKSAIYINQEIGLISYKSVLNNSINELNIATNPSSEGETTALYISELYKDKDIKISRLARGIPVGGDLEYTDEATLISAIEGRREI